MALIQCPECTNTVSNTAAACPKCGAPIALAASEHRSIGTPVSTIQQTSKRLKTHAIFSTLFWLVGLIWIIGAMASASNSPEAPEAGVGIPILLLIIGMIWYFVTKFRIWWHHK